jgi:Domain of unknown function (DUF4160)
MRGNALCIGPSVIAVPPRPADRHPRSSRTPSPSRRHVATTDAHSARSEQRPRPAFKRPAPALKGRLSSAVGPAPLRTRRERRSRRQRATAPAGWQVSECPGASLLRWTRTGGGAHVRQTVHFVRGPAISREPSPRAMSGCRRVRRQHGLCAYDQSVLRDLDRDVLRRPRTVPLPRSACAGQRKVRIESPEVIESALLRRQLRFVLAWSELHQDELRENWRRARAGETLQPIEPLR